VQIGNAITEKMLLDVLLAARDRNLYRAVTDCGAGGFSSAVGEMGEDIGAEVWLDRVPLKYEGLSYTEIWISEAQERMVMAVPPERWEELSELCASEGVEATVIGQFAPTGRLVLKYGDQQVADLAMEFLHEGRPPVVREAVCFPAAEKPLSLPAAPAQGYTDVLRRILGSWNVASKHWIIRQYDHEVQGGSVIKPLVGACNDGPGDASVIRPVLHSYRGLVIACGMNPCYGDLDTYWMAAAAIDEAIRNAVAVGADPRRLAILDNFCWGNTDKPDRLGSLVLAAKACYDLAKAYGTPFISGKDSLNNEFRAGGETIVIPPTLLISAIAIMEDVTKAVTMDAKKAGNVVYVVGMTRHELGGSHFYGLRGETGGAAPQVRPEEGLKAFRGLSSATAARLVRSCHDCSEGGLAVAAAEMAFAGALGMDLYLTNVPTDLEDPRDDTLLFSESNSRFVVEVAPQDCAAFEAALTQAGAPFGAVGRVVAEPAFRVRGLRGDLLIDEPIAELKEAWQKPLRW